MRMVPGIFLAFLLAACVNGASPTLRDFREFALSHDGDSRHGRELFFAEQSGACAKCHTLDGTGGKAGPDLSSVGDTFPRSELIRAILEPSATIAIGYGATIVETTS